MKDQTTIFSIFWQIEAIVAEDYIAQGLGQRIESGDIPPSVRYNERGELAKFAIVLPTRIVEAFEKRIADLRA